LLRAASYLDPRFKKHAFVEDEGRKQVKQMAIEQAAGFRELVGDFQRRAADPDEQPMMSLRPPPRKRARRTAAVPAVPGPVTVDSVVCDAASRGGGQRELARQSSVGFLLFGEPGPATDRSPRAEQLEAMVERELAVFASEPPARTRFACPLRWWRDNAWRFSHIAPVAMRLFSLPSATAGLERLFSAAGRAVNKSRPRLRPRRACMIITGHANVVRGITGDKIAVPEAASALALVAV